MKNRKDNKYEVVIKAAMEERAKRYEAYCRWLDERWASLKLLARQADAQLDQRRKESRKMPD